MSTWSGLAVFEVNSCGDGLTMTAYDPGVLDQARIYAGNYKTTGDGDWTAFSGPAACTNHRSRLIGSGNRVRRHFLLPPEEQHTVSTQVGNTRAIQGSDWRH